MSAGPAEITGLTQSIAYAKHLASEAWLHGPDGNEDYPARLAAAHVTGAGLATGRTMQDAFAAAAAAAGAHAAELGKQLVVQEAYDQAPDAGDKTYLTSNAGDARDVTSSPGPTQAKESPVDEDDDGPIDRLTGLRPKTLAAYRDYNKTTLPFLDRHTGIATPSGADDVPSHPGRSTGDTPPGPTTGDGDQAPPPWPDDEIRPQWPGHKPPRRWEWKVSAHKPGDPRHVNYGLASVDLNSEQALHAYVQDALQQYDSVELHHWYTGSELTFTRRPDGSVGVNRRQLNPTAGAPGHRR